MIRFGEKLHRLRVQHNLTLIELASRLGYTTHSYISEIESGRKQPTALLILKVARAFQVATDELMKDELEIHPFVDTDRKYEEREMSVVFAEREPIKTEIERFRLILSTFQDGTGMLALKKNSPKWIVENNARALPGWRDFERSVALAFGGRAIESKWIYDVALPDPRRPDAAFGISCKMRNTLHKAQGQGGRATLELTNAAGEMWDAIKANSELNEETYDKDPATVGRIIIDLVENWHINADVQSGGMIDNTRSCFLSLQYDRRTGVYQLFQFPIDLPDPSDIRWRVEGRRLIGQDEEGVIFEWYGFSGGQIKYYPSVSNAQWKSAPFQLERLPKQLPEVILNKASSYFSNSWQAVS